MAKKVTIFGAGLVVKPMVDYLAVFSLIYSLIFFN